MMAVMFIIAVVFSNQITTSAQKPNLRKLARKTNINSRRAGNGNLRRFGAVKNSDDKNRKMKLTTSE